MDRKWITAATIWTSRTGRADNHHSRGDGIITTKEVHKSLLEWKPISERIIKARYNSVFAKLSVIVCYAPTDDAEDEEKDTFLC